MDIKKVVKRSYKYILFLVMFFLFFYIKLPYYIMAPGGVINISDRVKLDGYSIEKGSINMLYVSEYKATPSLYLYSLLMNYDINKNEDMKIFNESIWEVEKRNKIMRDNSLDIALMVAYKKAGKHIEIRDRKNIVIATTNENGFIVGDVILEVDNIVVNDIYEIRNIINDKNENDYINFKILRNNSEKTIKCKVTMEDGNKVVGVVVMTNYDYDLSPKLDLKFKESESGSSGGLMLTLTIYNALAQEDIIRGRNIAGTGTISYDGAVGEIDGVKYKIMGAASSDIDIVFVPSSNYDEAIATKKKYNYKMEIVKVDTFDDVLNYLYEY